MAVTGMQIVKPRAMQLHADQWVVSGCGFSVFDATLTGTLRLWYSCVLLGQVLPTPSKA